MADATDSKSVARKGVWVQVPPPVLVLFEIFSFGDFHDKVPNPNSNPNSWVRETDWHRDRIVIGSRRDGDPMRLPPYPESDPT